MAEVLQIDIFEGDFATSLHCGYERNCLVHRHCGIDVIVRLSSSC